MAKCCKCKKSIKSGCRYENKRGTICEDCLEKELEGKTWKFGSELDGEEDDFDQKGVYTDADYVFVYENGKWVRTEIYFELFT